MAMPDMVRMHWANNSDRNGGDFRTTPLPATRASVLRAHSHGHAHTHKALGAHHLSAGRSAARHGSTQLACGLASFGRALPPREPVRSVQMVSSPRRQTQKERRAATARSGRGGRSQQQRRGGGGAATDRGDGDKSPRKNTKLATLRHDVNKVKVGVRLAHSMRDSTDSMLRSTDSMMRSREIRADSEASPDDDASSSTGSDEPHEHEVYDVRVTTPDIHVMLGPQLNRLGGMGGGFAMSPATMPRNWGPRGTETADLRARPPAQARPTTSGSDGFTSPRGLTVADAWSRSIQLYMHPFRRLIDPSTRNLSLLAISAACADRMLVIPARWLASVTSGIGERRWGALVCLELTPSEDMQARAEKCLTR